MSQILLTRADAVGDGPFDSIAWALEVHARVRDRGVYQSAVLYGNEDSPDKIEFYKEAEPLVTDAPFFTWVPGEVLTDDKLADELRGIQ